MFVLEQVDYREPDVLQVFFARRDYSRHALGLDSLFIRGIRVLTAVKACSATWSPSVTGLRLAIITRRHDAGVRRFAIEWPKRDALNDADLRHIRELALPLRAIAEDPE